MKRSQRSNKVLATAALSSSDRGISCFLYYWIQTDSTILISYHYFYLHLTIEDYLIENILRTQYDYTMSDAGLYLTAICMACDFLPVEVFKVQSPIMRN